MQKYFRRRGGSPGSSPCHIGPASFSDPLPRGRFVNASHMALMTETYPPEINGAAITSGRVVDGARTGAPGASASSRAHPGRRRSDETPVVVNRHAYPESRALHVLFLAGDDGRAAQLAGHWARALAGGCLQVEAADFDGIDSALASSGDQACLVVVIHAVGDPEPLVAHNSGGRIDWYLDGDATIECPVELASQLFRHVTRLLGDLGIHHEISDRSRALAA